MYLLLEGVESGGPISDVMEEVSEDMKAIKMIQRERKSLTSQQVSFLGMASLIAGPFVMGVVGSLPTIMSEMAAGLGPDMPLDEINSVVEALTFYVVAQAVAGAMMIGVILYGDMKKGLKFVAPMGLFAYFVFSFIKFAMPGMLAAMGG
jgi:flagellar protein FlaJ